MTTRRPTESALRCVATLAAALLLAVLQSVIPAEAFSPTAESTLAVVALATPQGAPRQRPVEIKPMYYVHVPKCGSSFGSVLLFTGCPGVPRMMRDDKTLRKPSLYRSYINHHCHSAFARFKNGHDPLPRSAVAKNSGHIVTMLRRPEDRFVSAFLHNLHDCTAMHNRWLEDGERWDEKRLRIALRKNSTAVPLLKQFFECVRGCATNMMAGRVCNAGRPDVDTAARARTVLRSHVGFVGLQEEYNTSVALWERMFGLRKKLPDVVYHNTRPNGLGAYKSQVYALVQQLDLRDEEDEELYDEASKWFAKRRAEYLLS